MIQVVTTVDALETAQSLAQTLVQRRLAACVQIDGPIHSVYRWNGQVEAATEWRLTIKTLRRAWPAVGRWIAEHHPYDVPEVVVQDIPNASESYLQWCREQVAEVPDAQA